MQPNQSGAVPQILTLSEAAERMKWSVRALKKKLADHGIGTIGAGRLARLTEHDVERLMQAEHQVVAPPPPSVSPADREALRIERMRRARRIGQMLRSRLSDRDT